jgi:diguanylate cyclase (GGDEF)-like protein
VSALEEEAEFVRLACLDQVSRSARRSAPAVPFMTASLIVIFGHAAPLGNMVFWALTVTAATALWAGCATAYLRRRRQGRPVGRWLIGPVSAAVAGLAWASLPLFVHISAAHSNLRDVYLLYLTAVSAGNAVGSAARRDSFFSFQLALLIPTEIACLTAPDRTTRLLGLAIPLYMVVMTILHEEVRAVVISELHLRGCMNEANRELRVLNTQLGEIALRDDLTGAANRVAFVDALARVVTGLRRGDAGVGIVFLDLDRFKVVNDSLGHHAGDELLVQAADRIRGVLREGDVLARLGGDEFTVLLRDLQGPYEAVDAAHRIHHIFGEPFTIVGREVPATASIGVTFSGTDRVTPPDLLRQADEAQYAAKERGRNRVEVFSPALHPSTRRRLDQEDELRQALGEGEIIAHFQPQIDLTTGRVVGAEALARWNHPVRGVLSAAEFIPLAEQSDLILEVDTVIRGSAIDARLALADAGCGPDFRIWCNVSAHQLTTADPIGDLLAQLETADCDPSGIGVELTETAAMAHLDVAARQVERVQGVAVRVALDDFGTGHSSLTLLRSVCADELKVDQSFVAGFVSNERDRAIVRAMCALGRELGLVLVAEGVETLAQAALLARLRCDRAQGFLWSPAIPLGEFLGLMHSAFPTGTGMERVGLGS